MTMDNLWIICWYDDHYTLSHRHGFILDIPIGHGDFPHGYVTNYQRVCWTVHFFIGEDAIEIVDYVVFPITNGDVPCGNIYIYIHGYIHPVDPSGNDWHSY